ncbi:uncharacterized protein LOC123508454 [Portunus trituberculatus]|uniref:uncharacterized protein LOC123508454 n=1 Tax=Portunus trituberculatus TaxID=210409 RepID=UPI001E1CBAF2|nr:uncharacterized protein LOC123508454 [Portunus trituberculatus]
MAKLVFPAILLVLCACGVRNHAHETYSTHAHLEESPTHAHTLGRWAGVAARNLSCGNLTNVVRLASITVDFIDEFKDDYTRKALGGFSWDVVNNQSQVSGDYRSIMVCMAGDEHCIPVLAQLPKPKPIHTEGELKEMMVKMMGYLQRYMVASESLVLDQSLVNDDLGFLNEMVDLNSYLEELNEIFLIPMTSCHLTPDPSLSLNLTCRMHQKPSKESEVPPLTSFCLPTSMRRDATSRCRSLVACCGRSFHTRTRASSTGVRLCCPV